MKKLSILFSIAAAALSLAACGDDGSSSSANNGGSDFAFDEETLDDLPNCTAEHERDTAFVKDGKKIYVCEDGRWEYLRAVIDSVGTVDGLLACTNSRKGDSVLVTSQNAVYVCGDGKWEKSYSRILTAESSSDFPACTDSRDGDKAYAASERTYYVCGDGKWGFSSRLRDSVSAETELPSCTEKKEGDSAYVKADNAVRLCRSERWLVLGESVETRDSLKNCTDSREGDRAFLENEGATLVCSGGKWYLFDIDDLLDESSSSAASSSSEAWEELPSSSSVASVSSSSVKASSSSSAISYGTLTDSRDGQVYKTVQIGEQVWMAENLNYGYNEGTAKSYCYNDKPDSCAKYGRLYLWSAAMDSAGLFSTAGTGCGYGKTCSPSGTVRGVCPEGWHLPSREEWDTLFSAVGGSSVAGTKLKSKSGWYSNGNGTDNYGFSALPAGYRVSDFRYAGYFADFWRASEYSSYNAYYTNLGYNIDYAPLYYDGKLYARSVRCLRDSRL